MTVTAVLPELRELISVITLNKITIAVERILSKVNIIIKRNQIRATARLCVQGRRHSACKRCKHANSNLSAVINCRGMGLTVKIKNGIVGRIYNKICQSKGVERSHAYRQRCCRRGRNLDRFTEG